MNMWDKLPREDGYRNRRENPSFSSTLLDAIYRSIDESNGSTKGEGELILYGKKHGSNPSLKEDEMQSACMVQKWMEKKVCCDRRRKSMADSERIYRNEFDDPMFTSSSSDSSCGGRFSSSESDSFYREKSRSWSSSSPSHYTTHSHSHSHSHSHRPKPIRTSVEDSFHGHGHAAASATQKKPKHEGGFVRTKSKALKIYSDLKKVKHPISPGGRFAAFLNSLFTAGNTKKKNITSSAGGYGERKSKSEQPTSSTCSSASSFSRSCLSKTPSSRGNGTKRSVRFCLDHEDYSRPCGHKNDHHQSQASIRKPIDKELELRIMEENRRVVEAAKDLLKNYQKKKEEYGNIEEYSDDEEEEEEEEDAASYASSELFELDNLSAIGIERYRQELPVYETTHLDTNRAIANSLIV
ncbi:hypothetical protein ES319_A05G426500v1 [Gossypium barbadense]|uniref:Protein BIG GRAIN 1-like A n=2 Tax=Gossypium TaxID=3633 RepID=A0A5J5W1J5_GOSBA|nr:hypothetical protein ES319_A05G426500v1 [Gossypium barbadense]KAB2085860.1 hypothetical protein ES319_A05G426500v1 [Gossypium barbadense]TYH20754.1 hypothetical protein ES288_A05G455000v1 [Gossypium darwinii]TYH20755.1 hypothetical protein ES288_A05G455000v1 [Gossypium darwinii]